MKDEVRNKVRFMISGKEFHINALAPGLDAAFIALHESYLGHKSVNWESFQTETAAFLDANPNDFSAHDNYFNNFTPNWSVCLATRDFGQAERIWELALEPVFKWEEANSGKRVHKGTPYYFWGMTALLNGDIDKGYTLMHQATEEDKQTTGQSLPDTPAMALATLNYVKADQAFRQWVLDQARFLKGLLDSYSARHSRTLSLDALRTRFLQAPPSIDALFLFAYVVARLVRLSRFPRHALRSPFAGQLRLNVFFDLALVIDAAIKNKVAGKWKFIDLAETLLQRAGTPLMNRRLRKINRAFNTSFDGTLQQALAGNHHPQ